MTNKPIWGGPEEEGITQSLLSGFLVCRERFRLRVVEGLKTQDTFNPAIEYGCMWHECEEAMGKGRSWLITLQKYTKGLCTKYLTQTPQIRHWYEVCKVQFPHYIDHYGNQSKLKKTLLSEQVFKVPYELPSGRRVYLKGKWDGVELLGKGKHAKIFLLEHKTKGTINEEQLERQLLFDLQTMFYLVALQTCMAAENHILFFDGEPFLFPKNKVSGLTYNVVRRPLSGGKGSIRRHKATKTKPEETEEHFYGKLSDIIADAPESFFTRWQVDVSQEEIAQFELRFLVPILEQLCDWWDQVSFCHENGTDPFTFGNNHWQSPYGVYNPMALGRATDMDDYLSTGNDVGLVRNTQLFPELENDASHQKTSSQKEKGKQKTSKKKQSK